MATLHLPVHTPGHTCGECTLLDKLESGMEEATRSAELIRKVTSSSLLLTSLELSDTKVYEP